MKKICISIILLAIITSQAQNKQIENALKSYDYQQAIQIIDAADQNTEMNILKAQCYKNLSKFGNAISILEQVVATDSSNLQALSNLADSYESIGKFKKSTSFYLKCIAQSPANNYFRLKYINSLFKLKDWNNTIREINIHFKKDTVNSLYGILGDCYWQKDRIDSAIVNYRKGLNVNPEDYNTVFKLAKIYLQNEEHPELIKCTNDYIAIDSTNKVINQYNGIGYCFTQQFDKAIYRLQKLYDDGDKTFTTNYFLGASYFGLQDYYKADEHLSEAYQQDSSNVNMLFYLGRSSIMIGNFKKGIAALNRGIEVMTPTDSVLYNFTSNLAIGFKRDLKYKESIKNYELCYHYKPESKQTLYTIASIYDYNLKDLKQALKYYNLFISKFPAEPREETEKAAYNNEMAGSYYFAVKNRIEELKTEQFFKK